MTGSVNLCVVVFVSLVCGSYGLGFINPVLRRPGQTGNTVDPFWRFGGNYAQTVNLFHDYILLAANDYGDVGAEVRGVVVEVGQNVADKNMVKVGANLIVDGGCQRFWSLNNGAPFNNGVQNGNYILCREGNVYGQVFTDTWGAGRQGVNNGYIRKPANN
eukprot:TRINITY_DN77503_c0_g1_i1.p2 TRINITY_DN77503_c0_g1~~TRINITY_DN77503_c0_g1_i1.p2  ORF type:complete len:160 (-),score=34.45 TRINITY_DN77503_c0_g1_i1:253-732(-)